MKLKYYLRGLGTGIIFTIIVMSIIFSYRTTDAKIMEQAKQMGMVMADGSGQSDSDKNNNTKPEKDTKKEEDKTTEPDTTKEEPTEPEPDTTKEEPTEPDTTKEEPTEPEPDTTTEAPTSEPPTEPDTSDSSRTEVTFTITSGMTSETVAGSLQQLGVVDNAAGLNAYMINNGYADRIRTGTYTFKTGSTYEEVSRIITG